MAVQIRQLITGIDSVGGTSMVTGPIEPQPNTLLLLAVTTRTNITQDPTIPTATGNGLNWVLVATALFDTTSASRKRITILRAMGPAPTRGAVTIDFAGQVQTDILCSIEAAGGVVVILARCVQHAGHGDFRGGRDLEVLDRRQVHFDPERGGKNAGQLENRRPGPGRAGLFKPGERQPGQAVEIRLGSPRRGGRRRQQLQLTLRPIKMAEFAREIDRLNDPDTKVARGLAALFHPVLYPGVGEVLRITQQELAYLVGLSRQRVNEALKTLQAQGLIRIEYGGVRVLDLTGLRRVLHRSPQ